MELDWGSFDRGVFLLNVLGIIRDKKTGRILVGRRQDDPFIKKLGWCFPGGRPAYEKGLEHYLALEIKKKTNLDAEAKDVLFARTFPEDRRFLNIYYLCEVTGGKEKAGEKFAEIKWVKPAELKRLFTTSFDPKLLAIIKSLK